MLCSFTKACIRVYIPVNAFLPPSDDPIGMTLSTLNLTVFDSGLQENGNCVTVPLQLGKNYSITHKLILTCTVQWWLCRLPSLENKVRHEQKDWNASSHTCTHIHHFDNLTIQITNISLQGKTVEQKHATSYNSMTIPKPLTSLIMKLTFGTSSQSANNPFGQWLSLSSWCS